MAVTNRLCIAITVQRTFVPTRRDSDRTARFIEEKIHRSGRAKPCPTPIPISALQVKGAGTLTILDRAARKAAGAGRHGTCACPSASDACAPASNRTSARVPAASRVPYGVTASRRCVRRHGAEDLLNLAARAATLMGFPARHGWHWRSGHGPTLRRRHRTPPCPIAPVPPHSQLQRSRKNRLPLRISGSPSTRNYQPRRGPTPAVGPARIPTRDFDACSYHAWPFSLIIKLSLNPVDDAY